MLFLGIIDFGFDSFYPLSALGFVLLLMYIVSILCRLKTNKLLYLAFPIFILFLHFCIVLNIILTLNSTFTYANQIWFVS